MSIDTVSDNLLLMEIPMRKIAAVLARDEFEALIEEALDDVYEDEEA